MFSVQWLSNLGLRLKAGMRESAQEGKVAAEAATCEGEVWGSGATLKNMGFFDQESYPIIWIQQPRHKMYILYMLLDFAKITKGRVLNKGACFDFCIIQWCVTWPYGQNRGPAGCRYIYIYNYIHTHRMYVDYWWLLHRNTLRQHKWELMGSSIWW